MCFTQPFQCLTTQWTVNELQFSYRQLPSRQYSMSAFLLFTFCPVASIRLSWCVFYLNHNLNLSALNLSLEDSANSLGLWLLRQLLDKYRLFYNLSQATFLENIQMAIFHQHTMLLIELSIIFQEAQMKQPNKLLEFLVRIAKFYECAM